MIYYIYEVPTEKIGATINPKSRAYYNFRKYEIESIILETMEGPDTPEYWRVVGDREWELADQYGYPRGEHYLAIRNKSNHNKKTTQNSRIKKGGASFSPGNHKEGATTGGYEMSKIVNTCEHCSHQGRGPNFYRYHAKNCKHKKTLTN